MIQQVDKTGNSEEIKRTGLLQGTYYLIHQDVCFAYKLTILV